MSTAVRKSPAAESTTVPARAVLRLPRERTLTNFGKVGDLEVVHKVLVEDVPAIVEQLFGELDDETALTLLSTLQTALAARTETEA